MYIYNDNHNWERGSETSAAMICYLKCTVFKKKKNLWHTKKQQVINTKAVKRNCVWGTADVQLSRSRPQSSYHKYIKRTNGNYV